MVAAKKDATDILKPIGLLLSALLCIGSEQATAEIQRFAVGTDDRPWGDWGSFDALDDQSLAGWIQPRKTTRGVNILNQLHLNGQLFAGRSHPPWTGFRPDQDGRIWSPDVPPAENSALLGLANGLSDSLSFNKFNRLTGNIGVSIIVDLGIPYPVEEIAFFPLDFGSHTDLFIKGYELLASDGSPAETDERGEPIFTLLDAVPLNTEAIVRNRNFSPRHLRYIKLTSTSAQAFELDQLEVRGEGYIRRAAYTSQVIDLDGIANLGRIVWAAELDPDSRLAVQTRIGRDQTTRIYHQIDELGEEVPLEGATDAENRRAYDRLPPPARGSIEEDQQNWTLWSAPYAASGEAIARDGPGRFIQFRVVMETDVPAARARLDSIAFEFSRPVMGRRITGQIAPRERVDLGQRHTFSYRIQPTIGAADTGFDTVELFTPAPAVLKSVRIGDRLIAPVDYQGLSEPDRLAVRMLNVEDRIATDEDVVELVFESSLLVYGTFFGGQVAASWQPDLLPQLIEEERVGDLVVLGSESSLGQVLSKGVARPGVFTPNGDRINDHVTVSFQISQVIGAAPLQVRIYDLSSRQVATLLDHPAESGHFQIQWDGRDASGRVVAPGVYLYRVELAGDTRTFIRSGLVGVAY